MLTKTEKYFLSQGYSVFPIQKYQCEYCGQIFTDLKDCDNHELTIHIKNKEKKLKC